MFRQTSLKMFDQNKTVYLQKKILLFNISVIRVHTSSCDTLVYVSSSEILNIFLKKL